MPEAITSYIVENDADFQKSLDRLRATTNDFRIPFNLIANEFYISNRKIFKLKSAGLYPELGGLNPNSIREGQTKTNRQIAEAQKKREVGFIYPILVRSGVLASSLTNRGDPDAVREVSKTSLVLGTNTSYAKYHQSDRARTKLPQRKVVFIDGGPKETSKGATYSGRREQWLNIINTYIVDKINEFED